jgi:sulfur-carrier protein adenylyltransferase/sulfurtransferase
MTSVKHITPMQLNELLAANAIYLVDVREAHERQICDIGGELIPLSIFATGFKTIPNDKPIILYCKAGGRSLQAGQFLVEQGYQDVTNLTGGILAWIDTIDSTMTSY